MNKITSTLQIALATETGKCVRYSLKKPKQDLTKQAVEEGVKTLLEAKIFAVDGHDLMTLKEAIMVRRTVEPIA